MIDDTKSDNTDDLLTSIDPLIQYSSILLNNTPQCISYDVPKVDLTDGKVVLEDILSYRSELSNKNVNLKLSKENLVKYEENVYDSDDRRTISEWSKSVTPQSSSRITSSRTINDKDINEISRSDLIEAFYDLKRDKERLQSRFNNANLEVQRVQMSNKQLDMQLRESKSAILSLTNQIEQVQQECITKEKSLENLDKTLGGLVSAWKKRESQKNQEIESLNRDISNKLKTIQELEEINEETKRAMLNADKMLTAEKCRHERIQKELMAELDSVRNEKSKLLDERLNLEKDVKLKQDNIRKEKEIINRLTKEVDLVRRNFEEAENEWRKKIEVTEREKNELFEQCNEMQNEAMMRENKIGKIREEIDQWEEEAGKWRRDSFAKSEEVNKLKSRLAECEDDKGVALRRLEKDLMVRFQEEHHLKMEECNQKYRQDLQNCNADYQRRLNERLSKHKLEMDKLRHVAEKEISMRVSDAEETIMLLRERLERAEKSVQFWQNEKESVEKARSQLSATLYNAVRYEEVQKQSMNSSNYSGPNSKSSLLVNPVIVNGGQSVSNFKQSYFEPIKNDLSDIPANHNKLDNLNKFSNYNYKYTSDRASLKQ